MTWRSLLFVPALEQRFIAKAAERGADAVVLDLEASIVPDRKAEARAALPEAVDHLRGSVDVTVRINAFGLEAVRDLEAVVIPDVSNLHLALCQSADQVRAIDCIVTDLEKERGLPEGGIGLVPMLETPEAVLAALEIAMTTSRVRALTLGVEDYATGMGVDATPEVLRPAAAQLIQAAKAAGRDALVVPHSMADYAALDALEEAARYARALGSTGGYAVHPAQIAVLNNVFSATSEELERSQKIVAAADAAEKVGDGIVKVDGRMIDAPLVTRARRVIEQAARP